MIMVILEYFGEEANGCDGHGLVSKSKETLYTTRVYRNIPKILFLPVKKKFFVILEIQNINCYPPFPAYVPIEH